MMVDTPDGPVKIRRKRWEAKHPGEVLPTYIKTEEHKKNLSLANKGKPSPRVGAVLTDDTKQLLSIAASGRVSNRKGVKLKPSTRKLISMSRQGISKEEDWVGFSKEKNYCWKWTDPELKIRKRVRAFFGNKCIECGATQANNKQKFLHVNHVGNNKGACCSDNPDGWLFVPLCTSCHSKASGTNQKNSDIKYTNIINTKYGGKCYFTLEEYDRLVEIGQLKTDDYGRRDGR